MSANPGILCPLANPSGDVLVPLTFHVCGQIIDFVARVDVWVQVLFLYDGTGGQSVCAPLASLDGDDAWVTQLVLPQAGSGTIYAFSVTTQTVPCNLTTLGQQSVGSDSVSGIVADPMQPQDPCSSCAS